MAVSRISGDHDNIKEPFYYHPLVLVFLMILNEVGLQFAIYFVILLPEQFTDELIKSSDKRDFEGKWKVHYGKHLRVQLSFIDLLFKRKDRTNRPYEQNFLLVRV